MLAPAVRRKRPPIFRQHLQSVKGEMDLANKQLDRVLWVLWINIWQLILSSSDLIKLKGTNNRTWDPPRDMHLGCLSASPILEYDWNVTGVQKYMHMELSKTDQAGEQDTVKYL